MRIEKYLDVSPIFATLILYDKLVRSFKNSPSKDLSVQACLILVAIFSEGTARPTQISKAFRLKAANLSHIINALEAMKWVDRARDPDDKRGYRLKVTTEGKKKVAKLLKAFDKLQSCFESHLGLGPLSQFIRVAKKITELELPEATL